MLIAAPGTEEDEHSSEVWAMIRYSWRHKVRVVVLNPEADGAVAQPADDKLGTLGIGFE